MHRIRRCQTSTCLGRADTRLAATRLECGAPADVAQLVEHFTRNEGVRGSNPRVGSSDSSQKPRSRGVCYAAVRGTARRGFTENVTNPDPGRTQPGLRSVATIGTVRVRLGYCTTTAHD